MFIQLEALGAVTLFDFMYVKMNTYCMKGENVVL